MVGSAQGDLYPAATTGGRPSSAATRRRRGRRAGRGPGSTVGDELRDVTFTARPGEIIGLAGLEGSGVATLLGVLFGTRRATRRRGPLPGRRRPAALAHERRAAGRGARARRPPAPGAHARPQHRAQHRPRVGGRARRGKPVAPPQRDARGRAAPDRAPADQGRRPGRRRSGSLSGGNQQKVVIGSWLEVAPRRDAARRPDAGRRRRREAGDLPAHPGARRRGPHRPVPLHRAAGARRPRRPHPRASTGAGWRWSSTARGDQRP